jgi:hypothetical protein
MHLANHEADGFGAEEANFAGSGGLMNTGVSTWQWLKAQAHGVQRFSGPGSIHSPASSQSVRVGVFREANLTSRRGFIRAKPRAEAQGRPTLGGGIPATGIGANALT